MTEGFADIKSEILKLPRTIKGQERELIQPPEYKRDSGQTGLGLNPSQRKKLKAIVAKETRQEIADVVDMIAGDEIKASPTQIMSAITGLALSVAVPLPIPIITGMLNLAASESGFQQWFNSMFIENRRIFLALTLFLTGFLLF